MRVLVTGAAGFIGAHVCQELVSQGHEALGALRPSSDPWRLRQLGLLPNRIRIIHCDITSPNELQSAFSSPIDAVIHCAAYGAARHDWAPRQALATNVEGSLNVYQAAASAHVPRFIHLGTAYEYGFGVIPLSEETPLNPSGIYAATKAAGYLVLREATQKEALGPVFFRAFNVYGPQRGPADLISQVLRAALAQEPLSLTAGQDVRDFVFVRDIARALVAAAMLPQAIYPARETFNLCTGQPRSVRQITEQIASSLGALHLMAFGALPSRTASPTTLVGNPSKWRLFCEKHGLLRLAEPTPLEQALDETIASIRNTGISSSKGAGE